MRIGIGLLFAVFAILSFLSSKQHNDLTGRDQYVNITQQQEIAMGLQAVPEMVDQFGGLDPNEHDQTIVEQVGRRLVQNSIAARADYPYEFHLLADTQTINAFALPGGPIFITRALYDRLQTEGQLAGVLSHEIMHVIARHSAEHIAETQLTEGLTGAVVVASYDHNNPHSAYAAQFAILVGQLVNMKFGRDDELESDRLGLRVMAEAGYDPRAMLQVMQVLQQASQDGPPEFFSTHPSPDNRMGRIQTAIEELFPNGVPEGLTP
jgi:predicted Zn-dependent protease